MTLEADDTTPMSGVEMAARFEAEHQALLETIRPLSDAQLAAPSTPTAWAVKDHLAHLAVWAGGIVVLLRGETRWTFMGLEAATAKGMSVDEINAVIYEQQKDKSLAAVRAFFDETHATFRDKIHSMSADDLARPYGFYQPEAPSDHAADPIVNWIVGDSYEHYAEHREWIQEMMAEKGWA